MSLTTFSLKRSDFTGTPEEWSVLRATAAFIVKVEKEEVISGDSAEMIDVIICASGKEPYGNVHYCDDGMQTDGKKRFPVNTAERVRAAWSYSHHKNVMSKYTASQLSRLHSCIEKAWKATIDKSGPPSAE